MNLNSSAFSGGPAPHSLLRCGLMRVVLLALVCFFVLHLNFGNQAWATATFSEYIVSDANSQPTGIVNGPDGNIWFADGNNAIAGKIGTRTMAGTITM